MFTSHFSAAARGTGLGRSLAAMPPDEQMTVAATRRSTLGRRAVGVLLAVACAGIAAMWIYGLFIADPEPVYRIEDASWRPQAIAICAAADAAITSLSDTTGGFITDPTPEQMRRRADLADQATAVLDQMVSDLVAVPVDNDDDRLRLDVFAEHYRMVLADRLRYTTALRAGDNVEYTETVVAGGPVTNVITDFTAGVKGNDIPLCSPPADLSRSVQP